MKTKKKTPPPSRPAARKTSSGLNLNPADAEREADKLHELRDDLESGATEEDTSARSSPLGRDD